MFLIMKYKTKAKDQRSKSFITSEIELDYYCHRKLNVRVATRLAKRFTTENLRK